VKAANFAGAIAVSVLLALPLIVPTVAHIDTWKIVLGLAGLALFVGAGLDSRRHT
jgi:ABC-type Fe3+ transport system permease subunit